MAQTQISVTSTAKRLAVFQCDYHKINRCFLNVFRPRASNVCLG